MDNKEQGSEITEAVNPVETGEVAAEAVAVEAPPEESVVAEEAVAPEVETVIEQETVVETFVSILQLKPGEGFEYGGDNFELVSLVALVKNVGTGVFGNIDPNVLVKKT